MPLPHQIPIPRRARGGTPGGPGAITLYVHPNTQSIALTPVKDYEVARFPDDLPPHPIQLRLYDTIAEALAFVEGIEATDRDDVHTLTYPFDGFAAALAVWTDDGGVAGASVPACVELVDRRTGAPAAD